ncbi:FtsW/RodA/SpoVE family cell cycle protein [Longispora albida]|uniref:FtsW/RodA/SpoVE family cell cycle protein n=1 Tax=Longispora albida TaxID=203523 RepID=UPI000364A25C|nr:putative peptidoglycan glycosyltransferase FtsW [Longispora albida]
MTTASARPATPLAAWRGLLARPLASYYLLLASVGLLVAIGLVMVFSATSVTAYVKSGNAFAVVTKQATWAVLGLIGFWLFQRLPVRTYRALGTPLVIVAICVQAFMFVGGLMGGKLSFGGIQVDAQGIWLHIGSMQVQPAEFAKLALVLWAAELLVRKRDVLDQPKELAAPLFPVAGLLLGLVGYHDLGTMLCMLATFGALLWIGGVRLRILGLLLATCTAAILALIWLIPSDYREARLKSFWHPELDPTETGLQAMQSYYAIGRGGWFGVGLGASSLKWGYLPEEANDFIYAVIAEELGVVGCAVVLALFGVLAYAGLRIARRVADPFRRLAAGSATIWLAGQAILNMCVVIGLVPITGVTLPFISAGGSSLVVSLAAVGMLASFARAEPEAAAALHARPPGKWGRLLWAPLPPLPGNGADRAAPRQRSGTSSKGRS